MIAKTKIKTGGVNTSDAVIIVYKNTKEELPLIGQQKILYLVIPTSELYIWTGNAYCKINGVSEDTLSSLIEKFKKDFELSSTEFAALTLRLEEVDNETKKKFIEIYATIESVATSQEEVKQELNETLNILSKDLETYKEESGKELFDLAEALASAETTINEIHANMGNFMKDGIFETAEIAAIGQMYNQLFQTFNTLSKQYHEAIYKIESIVDKNQNDENFDEDTFFQEEFPYFLEMKNIWSNEDGNVLFNDTNISQYIYQLQQNKISLDSLNLNSLFSLILCLCQYLPKDKVASAEEITVWNNANAKLTDKLNSFEEYLRQTMAAIALFDANDELQEAVGNVNSVMNGLQKQIDGQIINWNDKGLPLPLYDHSKKKWYNGSDWVDEKQTVHKGPSSEWEEKYDQHINDTYVDLTTGGAYRWCNTEVGYHWCKITDTATEEVLKKSAELEGALDRKTTTFLQNYPTPPYHKGDLWIVHENYEGYKKGEILNCITSSNSGFNITHWSRECSYTDDSRAIQAEVNAKNYSDGQIAGVNTSIAALNNMFADGVLLPNEKPNILYKLYNMLGVAAPDDRYNSLLLLQDDGIDKVLSVNIPNCDNYQFAQQLANSDSECELTDFCYTLTGTFSVNHDIWKSSPTTTTYQLIKLRNAISQLVELFNDVNSDNGINSIIASLELFSEKSTKLNNPTQFLDWCEVFDRCLQQAKFYFLEYRISLLESKL